MHADHCSENALGNGSIPVDFDRLISSTTSDNSVEQSTCIEEISEEESKLMEEYFNWGQE
jgi:hypothetical protein